MVVHYYWAGPGEEKASEHGSLALRRRSAAAEARREEPRSYGGNSEQEAAVIVNVAVTEAVAEMDAHREVKWQLDREDCWDDQKDHRGVVEAVRDLA